MVDKIEMSLDDIIKADRGQRKPGVGGKRGQTGARRGGAPQRGPRRGVSASPRKPQGSSGGTGGAVLKGRARGGIQKAKFARGDVNSAWKHDMYDGPKRGAGAGSGLTKLVVGNLDYGVSNTDIKELFNEFGTLKKASVHYDRSGRSLGTADVIFERRSDALKAIKQYNGVPLDGRPMSIQLATDLPALPARGVGIGAANAQLKRRPVSSGPPGKRVAAPAAGAARRGFNKARVGGKPAGRAPRERLAPPTAEELDAELDAYVNDMKA